MKNKHDILIITVDGDMSSDDVMDWLSYLNHNPIRWNVNNDLANNLIGYSFEFSNSVNEIVLKIDGEEINLKDIKTVWFRKYFNPDFMRILNLEHAKIETSYEIINHLTKEYRSGMFSIFDSILIDKKTLGDRITKQPSKMDMLIAAKHFEIEIPNTLITTKKAKLKEFLKLNKEVITKTIKDGNLFVKENSNSTKSYASTYTELLNKEIVDKMSDNFLISLFQEKLDKEIEIRSFYLDGKFYSSAIFSQLDRQTDIDFRMYNNEKPNRTIPFKLPSNLETKLIKLMNFLKLKTGSLDLIKTKTGKYVFLEVNPWGQYGMVSIPCNYNLDKKIAQYLI